MVHGATQRSATRTNTTASAARRRRRNQTAPSRTEERTAGPLRDGKAGRAAELLRGAGRRLVGRIADPLPARHAARQRQVFALVVRQRLVGPVEQRERDPQGKPEDDARDDPAVRRPGGPPSAVQRVPRTPRQVHRRPSNRSAEICSDTSPTRKTTTAKRISSTDEFV